MTPKRFKHIRARAGYTQERLGRHLGVATRSVRRYEAGDRAISGPVINLMEVLLYQTDRRHRRPQALRGRT